MGANVSLVNTNRPESAGDMCPIPERYWHELTVESAIDPAIIKRRGVYYEADPIKLQALGFASYQALPGLVFPEFTTAGVQIGYILKPDRPRIERKVDERTGEIKERVIKYESVAGRRPMIDAGPDNRDLLRDATIPLVFTEGIKKRDSLGSQKIGAVSINGTWAFMSERLVIPDFDDIALNGRSVYLCFDSDVMKKRSVREALHRLKEALKRRGARVRAIYLPDAPDGAKWGADDYFANGYTVAEFWRLAADMPDPDTVDASLDELADYRLAERDATIADLEAELKKERSARYTERRLLGDARRPAQERINCYFLAWEMERVSKHQHGQIHHAGGPTVAVDDTGAVLTSVKDLAILAGTSPKHMGDTLKKFESEGVIQRPPVTRVSTGEEVVDRDGVIKAGFVSICRIRPSGSIESLRSDLLMSVPVQLPQKAKKAPAYRCGEHPDADIIRRTTHECSVCHQEVAPERITRHAAGTPFEEPEAPTAPTSKPLAFTDDLNTPQVISEFTTEDRPLSGPQVFLIAPQVISDAPGDQRPKKQSAWRDTDRLLFSMRSEEVQAEILAGKRSLSA